MTRHAGAPGLEGDGAEAILSADDLGPCCGLLAEERLAALAQQIKKLDVLIHCAGRLIRTKEFEIDMIRHALYLTNGHQSFAAKLLGIKKTTLHAKLKRFSIDRKMQVSMSK